MSTVQPSNNSELQLYRVLQRANLLPYFETFITQGGDDVQQLCEAGEDEFLEIMALVGMASKPLHVRRLQKALQEWVSTPSVFEASKKCPTHVMSITCSSAQNVSPSHSIERTSNLQDYKITPSQSSTISTSTPWSSQARDASPSDGSNLDDPSSSNSPQGGDFKDIMKDVLFPQNDTPYSGVLAQPVLLEHQISAIAAAAALLAQELPSFEPKSMPKKQISKDITKVMMMSLDEPGRMNAMRRYAAIYGRFDSKRKNHRPMSSHEISVNEAAAQLCSHIPALLTRREELFPLARQVVRDSGYQYSKGHSRAAEILIQPKLEEGDTVATTSSSTATSVISEEDSFNDLQS
uniref:NAB co-repressor domain-containing protein n=1 Tax=Arion vulgaris TaxID=1028688 RepID=A0A0B6ZMQ6_9EUPU